MDTSDGKLKEEITPLKAEVLSPVKRSVAQKRTLFTCYNKSNESLPEKGEKSDIASDDELKMEASASNVDKHMPIFAPATKKTKTVSLSDDVDEDDEFASSQGSTQSCPSQFSQQSCSPQIFPGQSQQSSRSLSQGNSPYSNVSMKSPFKSKKPSSTLRQLVKTDRRFSGLPTNVSVVMEEEEEPEPSSQDSVN